MYRGNHNQINISVNLFQIVNWISIFGSISIPFKMKVLENSTVDKLWMHVYASAQKWQINGWMFYKKPLTDRVSTQQNILNLFLPWRPWCLYRVHWSPVWCASAVDFGGITCLVSIGPQSPLTNASTNERDGLRFGQYRLQFGITVYAEWL